MDDPTSKFVRAGHSEGTERRTLKQELINVLNRHSAENESGTPDYILAEYLMGCLTMLEQTIVSRANWRGESIDAPVVVQARDKRDTVPLVIYDTKGGRNVIGEAKIHTTPGEMGVTGRIEAAVALFQGSPALYHDPGASYSIAPNDFGRQDGG